MLREREKGADRQGIASASSNPQNSYEGRRGRGEGDWKGGKKSQCNSPLLEPGTGKGEAVGTKKRMFAGQHRVGGVKKNRVYAG